MTETVAVSLPAHMEERRAQILDALREFEGKIVAAHAAATAAIDALNGEIAEFNRVLDHVDGWSIEACEVIAKDLMKDENAANSDFLVWRQEIANALFYRLTPVEALTAPDMPHAQDFEALPASPNGTAG